MNIAFIGPRGTGKSKFSRKLSKITGMPVISTDMVAVYESGGISIPELIKKHNGDWRHFRNLETEILQKLQGAQDIILDCGGGILFDVDENGNEFFSENKLRLLHSIATVISLSRPTDYLIKKIKNDPTRPPLSQIQSYEKILKKRLPYYKKAAHQTIHLQNITTTEVIQKILAILAR